MTDFEEPRFCLLCGSLIDGDGDYCSYCREVLNVDVSSDNSDNFVSESPLTEEIINQRVFDVSMQYRKSREESDKEFIEVWAFMILVSFIVVLLTKIR